MAKNNKRCLSRFITATMVMISLTATENVYAKDNSSYNKSYSNKSYSNKLINSTNSSQYNEQAIYNKIYDSIVNLEDIVDISNYISNISTDANKASKVFYKVLNDHSEIFYVSKKISYNYGTEGNGNPILKINITYNGSKDDIRKQKVALNKEIDRVIAKYITSSMSDLEKEMAIHDYLVLNTKYDEENYKNNTVPDVSHTSYGALINRIAVCDGYSNAFKLLLSKVGINSIIVSSEQMHHAWNIVTLENHNYQVDVTWDDPVPDREGKVRYKYFNLDDDSIKKDKNPHTWNENEYPKCNDNKYSYLSNIEDFVKCKDNLYYKENGKQGLFKVDINGLQKKTIINDNVESFVINGEYIYYTNYSKNGYIHKVKKDGTEDMIFKNVSARNLTLENNKLNYEDYRTSKKNTIILNDILMTKIEKSKDGWKEEEGNKVYYKDGKNITGLQSIEGKNYFFNLDGKMQTGWHEITGKKYYFDPITGQAFVGKNIIESNTYEFDKDGTLIKKVIKETVKPKEEHKEIKSTSNKEGKKDEVKASDKEKQKETVKSKEEHKEVKSTSNKEEKKDEVKQAIKSLIRHKNIDKTTLDIQNDNKNNIKVLAFHKNKKSLISRNNDIISNNKNLSIKINDEVEKNVTSNKNSAEKVENKNVTKIVDNKKNNNTIETKKINDKINATNKENNDKNKKETSNKKSFFEKILDAIKEIFEKILSIFK